MRPAVRGGLCRHPSDRLSRAELKGLQEHFLFLLIRRLPAYIMNLAILVALEEIRGDSPAVFTVSAFRVDEEGSLDVHGKSTLFACHITPRIRWEHWRWLPSRFYRQAGRLLGRSRALGVEKRWFGYPGREVHGSQCPPLSGPDGPTVIFPLDAAASADPMGTAGMRQIFSRGLNVQVPASAPVDVAFSRSSRRDIGHRPGRPGDFPPTGFSGGACRFPGGAPRSSTGPAIEHLPL